MISLIICSRRSDISDELKQNIKDTIGTDYELIVVDNSGNKYSIFSAYNLGMRSAKGDLLCFMHEDILYHTKDWGVRLEKYFGHYTNVGMVGIAGGHFLPKMPAAWWDTEMRSGHLLQGSTVNGEYKIIKEDYWTDYKKDPTLVVSVDGVWMCFRKVVFDYISWDDKLFHGFHSYDTDISLQVWQSGYEVHIFWDVLIEHKSVGVAQIDFYNSLDVLYKKWESHLPIIKGVNPSPGEQVARVRIAELRHELFYTDFTLREIGHSRAYRWWSYLQEPMLAVDSLKSHFKRLFRCK